MTDAQISTSSRVRHHLSSAFYIALAANALFFFSFQGTFPVLPRFIAEVVVRRSPDSVGDQVGLATAALSLVAVLTRIPAGHWADRFGRRRFMFAGAACFTLAPLIFSVSQGMPLFLLGRVVQGVGMAMFTTAFQALVADLAPAQRRGEALGLAGASTSIAFISAPVVGDRVAAELGYTAFFQMSAVIAAASMLLVFLIAAPAKRRSDQHPSAALDASDSESSALDNLRLALVQKGVRASVLTMAALGIPFGAFITFLPLFAQERQIAGIGAVFSVYSGAIFLAQPLSGRLSDRMGRYRVILPGLAITSLATVVLALDSSLLVFGLAGIILGLGVGLTRGGVDALVQDSVSPTLRGTAAAIQYTSFDFWIGLGSYPIGLLANALGYAVTFVVTGVLCLGGGGALTMILRGTRGKNSSY